MGILYTLEDVIEQHRGKYAVTVTVRDYRGIATEFSIVKVFDDMIDAVSMCKTLCEFEIEYSAPVEHPRPAKLNSTVAENEQHRRSSCTLTS